MRKILFIIAISLFACGCATSSLPPRPDPDGEKYTAITTIRVLRNGFVETVELESGVEVNIQINEKDPNPLNKSYPTPEESADQDMTIGKFSKVIGSGFSKKKNIYFRKGIYNSGSDYFTVDDVKYKVEWDLDYWAFMSWFVNDVYDVTFYKLKGATPKPLK